MSTARTGSTPSTGSTGSTVTAAIAAEWVKLRSVRSTVLACGVVLLAGALTTWLTLNSVGIWDDWSPRQRAEAQASRAGAPIPWIGETTFTLAYLAFAVIGALAASSEYATGTARTSLLGTSRRSRWLVAKATTVGGFSLVVGAVVLVPTALVADAIVGDRNIGPPYVLGDGGADALAWAFAGALVATVIGLVGVGVGMALRSTAAAVTVSAGLLLVPGMIAVTLPASVAAKLTAVLLPNLVAQLAGTPYSLGELSPPQAAAVLACYLVAALGAGAVVLHRRDAG